VRRRDFIALVGAAAAGIPIAARAQQSPRLPTVGFLVPGTPESHGKWVAAFAQRLRELGWIEGRNLTIEYRWAEGRNERMAEYATEFVGLKVDVIVTSAGGADAAKQATSVIPIIFAAYGDPVAAGLMFGAPWWQRYGPDDPANRSYRQAPRSPSRDCARFPPLVDYGQRRQYRVRKRAG
jgi:putative ABC transport system substrate-binding protein